MAMNFPNIGDWVSFYSQKDKTILTGFMLYFVSKNACVVYVPYRGRYGVLIVNLIVEEPSLSQEDIPALIDLALDTRDEVWFHDLTNRVPRERN